MEYEQANISDLQHRRSEAVARIPHIHLLCIQKEASDAFTIELKDHSLDQDIQYTVHDDWLAQLDPGITFDLVVSPANSYGILDGGFDDAISKAFSPQNDYIALTRVVQAELYDTFRGMLPPGTCHIVRIPDEFRGQLKYNDRQGWGCRYIAMCPTMRVPQSCTWDREVRSTARCLGSSLHLLRSTLVDTFSIRKILLTPLGRLRMYLVSTQRYRTWESERCSNQEYLDDTLGHSYRWLQQRQMGSSSCPSDKALHRCCC